MTVQSNVGPRFRSEDSEQAGPSLYAARNATARIAPVWPLSDFVAVNPFLGMTDRPFADAARLLARTGGTRLTMPPQFYAAALARGEMSEDDIRAALLGRRDASGTPVGYCDVKAVLNAATPGASPMPLPTVADIAARASRRSWDRFVTERISAWAGAYFDRGQSMWSMPARDLPPYEAWRTWALVDRTPEISGLKGFRRFVAGLPEAPADLIEMAEARLGLPPQTLETYFHRLLMTIGGWASYARYLEWHARPNTRPDDAPLGLLAVRLAWDLALLDCVPAKHGLDACWDIAKTRYEDDGDDIDGDAAMFAIEVGCVLQDAYERGWQHKMTGCVEAGARAGRRAEPSRPAVQAVFCIDVRSEILRRALERVSPRVETIGFAGFFGFPVEYVGFGRDNGDTQCPVLIEPKFTVREAPKGVEGVALDELRRVVRLRRRAMAAWKSFKLAAVSCFGFVEVLGLPYLARLVTDSLGVTRPVPHPRTAGLGETLASRLGPRIDPGEQGEQGERPTGIRQDARVDVAEGALRGMSLTENFARLVVLAGHGSTSVNNPHAAGLDCGACGGHSGEANARVAAAVLNDPDVRQALAGRGITIPDDTVFVAALHDTTTDRVTLFGTEDLPLSHHSDIEALARWFDRAGDLARRERAESFGIGPGDAVHRRIDARSRDWSQVRPEWGLAGCATFIAAPRARTAGTDFGGRAFLHSYDWTQDTEFSVLEMIMTAPMIVASWISLQYYGSVVDGERFGSGNKVLHNVVGSLGILEGNGGDLRTGLPWQSVHDGEKLVHEPLRLSVLIEAPVEAIGRVIERTESVRGLVDNGWLALFALDADGSGRVVSRYCGAGRWESLHEDAIDAAA